MKNKRSRKDSFNFFNDSYDLPLSDNNNLPLSDSDDLSLKDTNNDFNNSNHLLINMGDFFTRAARLIKGFFSSNKARSNPLKKLLSQKKLNSNQKEIDRLNSELKHNISAFDGKPLQSGVMEMASHKETVSADHDFKEEVQKVKEVVNDIKDRVKDLSNIMDIKSSKYGDIGEELLKDFLDTVKIDIDKLNEAIEKLPDDRPYHDLGKDLNDLCNQMEKDQGIAAFMKKHGKTMFKGETYQTAYQEVSLKILQARGDVASKEPEMEENQNQTKTQDTTPSFSR